MKIENIIFLTLSILYFLNDIYFRTIDHNFLFLNVLFGSLPSFIGAYILTFLAFEYAIPKFKMKIKVLYLFGTLISIFLITDEIYSLFSGNKVFDTYDLIALILGVLVASLIFVRRNKRSLFG